MKFTRAIVPQAGNSLAMLSGIYIEALLVDEELADRGWEAWDAGEIVEKQIRPPVPSLGGEAACI